jgi:hypothetical protein
MKERMAKVDRDLTADQIRDIVEGRLAKSGNDNLKVGKITAKGDDIVALDITTKTGAIVSTREISMRTGLPVGAEQRCDRMVERLTQAAARGDVGLGFRGPGRGGPRDGMMGGPRGRMAELGFLGKVGPDRDLNLTEDQVRTLAEAGLIVMGNPNLRVGAIKEKDANTYVVDIVASDKSLVMQREIDRHSGRPSPVR